MSDVGVRLKEYGARLLLFLASLVVALLLGEGGLTVYRLAKHGKVGREDLIVLRRALRDDVVGGPISRLRVAILPDQCMDRIAAIVTQRVTSGMWVARGRRHR
jgi:hypothetical protein